MHTYYPQIHAAMRLAFFLGVFFIMAILELIVPRRALTVSKARRWITNLSLVILDSILIRAIFPTALVGVAIFAHNKNLGIFSQWNLTPILAIAITVVVLDFVIYLQHVMFHAIPVLWKVHRAHHLDLDFDVTTGIRFHPIEIFLSLLIKTAVILLLGAPVWGVVVFEIILNATSMFNHGNIKLPTSVDKIVRLFIVTPDMHRVHHSVEPLETNSNFGFSFSCWDRICGTYKAHPNLGHQQMLIGLKSYRNPLYCINLLGLLTSPFRRL